MMSEPHDRQAEAAAAQAASWDAALRQMGEHVYAINRAKGWHDVNPKVDEFLAIISERGIYTPGDRGYMAMREVAILMFGPRSFGDDIALLHSEVSEMLEAYRDYGMTEPIKYESDDGFAIVQRGDVNDRNWSQVRPGKPLGVGSEAADVLVRLLDTCKRYGIDLGEQFRLKTAYNATRPARHGGKRL